MKLTNRQIGAVGVSRVASALFRLGYSVLAPLEDFAGYDLVAEKRGKFTRIQVKTSERRENKGSGNRYGFMTSKGNNSSGKFKYAGEADIFVLWGMDDDLFWVRKTKECRGVSHKCQAKTGSSWRILADL